MGVKIGTDEWWTPEQESVQPFSRRSVPDPSRWIRQYLAGTSRLHSPAQVPSLPERYNTSWKPATVAEDQCKITSTIKWSNCQGRWSLPILHDTWPLWPRQHMPRQNIPILDDNLLFMQHSNTTSWCRNDLYPEVKVISSYFGKPTYQGIGKTFDLSQSKWNVPNLCKTDEEKHKAQI